MLKKSIIQTFESGRFMIFQGFSLQSHISSFCAYRHMDVNGWVGKL